MTSEREPRSGDVAGMCREVNLMLECGTDVESTDTQCFETRACEMEAVKVRLTELKDVKFQ